MEIITKYHCFLGVRPLSVDIRTHVHAHVHPHIHQHIMILCVGGWMFRQPYIDEIILICIFPISAFINYKRQTYLSIMWNLM